MPTAQVGQYPCHSGGNSDGHLQVLVPQLLQITGRLDIGLIPFSEGIVHSGIGDDFVVKKQVS